MTIRYVSDLKQYSDCVASSFAVAIVILTQTCGELAEPERKKPLRAVKTSRFQLAYCTTCRRMVQLRHSAYFGRLSASLRESSFHYCEDSVVRLLVGD